MASANSEMAFDVEATDLHALRHKRVKPEPTPFRGVDTFEGIASNPLTLHKYAYGNDNPVNNIDPSGNVSIPSLLTGFGAKAILFRMTLGATIGGLDAAFRGYSIMQGAAWGAAFGFAGPLIPWKLGLVLSAYGVGEALADGDWDSAIFRGAVSVVGLGTYRLTNGWLPGGRQGGVSTQLQNTRIGVHLSRKGWQIIGGGGRGGEEFIPGPGPGTAGSTYVDITATKMIGGQIRTLRVQTVDTRANGQPTNRELAAAGRIKQAKPNDGLILVPKQLQDGAIITPPPFGDDDSSEWSPSPTGAP